MTNNTIEVTLNSEKKQKPQDNELQFGKAFTDHMFIMDYSTEQGWYDPRVVPYQPLDLAQYLSKGFR